MEMIREGFKMSFAIEFVVSHALYESINESFQKRSFLMFLSSRYESQIHSGTTGLSGRAASFGNENTISIIVILKRKDVTKQITLCAAQNIM